MEEVLAKLLSQYEERLAQFVGFGDDLESLIKGLLREDQIKPHAITNVINLRKKG